MRQKIRLQRRRRSNFFWLFAAGAVFALVFGEQIAVLYVLSTLAMCGLLIVVAISEFEAKEADLQPARDQSVANNTTTHFSDLRRGEGRPAYRRAAY